MLIASHLMELVKLSFAKLKTLYRNTSRPLLERSHTFKSQGPIVSNTDFRDLEKKDLRKI